jgi:molybdopterin-guanine dinucleotide biosynthesis protein A
VKCARTHGHLHLPPTAGLWIGYFGVRKVQALCFFIGLLPIAILAMHLPAQISRAAFLLAGGKSSRMGTNKALLEFRGQTLLARGLHTLAAACGDVTIVGDHEAFASHGRVVSDIFPGCGPLAGIHTALHHSSAELNLMLAVDMPFISVELLQFLFLTAQNCDALVTVPRTRRGLQPLCAVYRPDFAAVAARAIQAGNYKVDAGFSAISLRVLEGAELNAAGFSEQNFFNLNTPADRSAAESFSSNG